MEEKRLRLGEILVDAGVLKQKRLEAALALQKQRGIRLGQILLQEGFISEPQLVQALSRRLSIPWVSLDYVDIADELLELVPAHVAEEFFLIPVYVQSLDRKNRTLFVAMNDPTDEVALRFVSASAGMLVKPMVAGPSDISAAIQTHYYGEEETDYETPMIHGTAPAASPVEQPPVQSKPPPPPTPTEKKPADKQPIEQEPVKSISEVDLNDSDIVLADEMEGDNDEPREIEDIVESRHEAEEKQQRLQRELEKHMFGVGSKRRGMSLTLLDGTKIDFGGASRKSDSARSPFSKEDLVEGLRAAAAGTPMEDFLPTEKWEDFMAALLQILFKKNLIFFDELLAELNKNNQ
jgi:type IV pilus assembly protein PilB